MLRPHVVADKSFVSKPAERLERKSAEARKYVSAGLANQYVGQITPTVRQALFGNVGTLIVFRLGHDDANMVSKELGAFTAEEVLNLGVGQAFVRSGMSANTFNLQAYPKPAPATVDPTSRIQALTRTNFARPVGEVESEMGEISTLGSNVESEDASFSSNSEDPSEDDFVV